MPESNRDSVPEDNNKPYEWKNELLLADQMAEKAEQDEIMNYLEQKNQEALRQAAAVVEDSSADNKPINWNFGLEQLPRDEEQLSMSNLEESLEQLAERPKTPVMKSPLL